MKSLIAVKFILLLYLTPTASFSQNLGFTSIHEIPAIKRGKVYEINWSGGVPDEHIAIQLVNKSGLIRELNTVANTGQHSIQIPGRTKPGKYSLKLVSIKSGEISASNEFSIKRRIPLAVQLSPLIVVPAILILVHPKDENRLADPVLPNLQ